MKPNCLKCEFFFITWETSHPRGCHKFGFKGKELPSELVYKTSGAHCPFFVENRNSHKRKDSAKSTTK